MGYVVKEKVGDMEDNTREGRSRRMSKYLMLFVQAVVGKNNFLGQFECGKKKDMSYVFLLCVFLKEEVCLEMYEPISDLHKKNNVDL